MPDNRLLVLMVITDLVAVIVVAPSFDSPIIVGFTLFFISTLDYQVVMLVY